MEYIQPDTSMDFESLLTSLDPNQDDEYNTWLEISQTEPVLPDLSNVHFAPPSFEQLSVVPPETWDGNFLSIKPDPEQLQDYNLSRAPTKRQTKRPAKKNGLKSLIFAHSSQRLKIVESK